MKNLILWVFGFIWTASFLFPSPAFNQRSTSKRETKIVPGNFNRKTSDGKLFMDYENSWAILIGINDFKHWPDLDFAINDVQAFRDQLIKYYNFKEENIIIYRNKEASLKNLLTLLEGDFINNIKKNDRLIFFWAGHGETRQFPSGRQSGYLIPYDGRSQKDKDRYTTYLSMDRISQFAKRCAAKHILFLVDACYSGFAAATRGVLILPPSLENYYLEITREPGRHIITAGRKGEQVLESPDWGHSAFTYKLLYALEPPFYAADADKNGLITTKELASYLIEEVSDLTKKKHTPVFANLEGKGEFVFVRPDIDSLIIDTTRYQPPPPPPPPLPAEFLEFQPNEFQMGDTYGDGDANERPVRRVTVGNFYILDHEVTNKEYFEFVRAENKHFPVWMQSIDPVVVDPGCYWHFRRMGEALTAENHPVVGVSWEDAQAYCEWLGEKYGFKGRLPTEAEWEYVARLGGQRVRFPNGKDQLTQDEANLRGKGGKDQWEYTAPVGSFGPNEFGLADLAGNVWEWCCANAFETGSEAVQQEDQYIIRGGSYDTHQWQCRATKRLIRPVSKGSYTVGFRVVLIRANELSHK